MIQVHVGATPWRFDSSRAHHLNSLDTGSTVFDEIRFGTDFVDVVGEQASGPLNLDMIFFGRSFTSALSCKPEG